MNDSEAFWFLFLSNRVVLEWKLILKRVNPLRIRSCTCMGRACRAEHHHHHLSQSNMHWDKLENTFKITILNHAPKPHIANATRHIYPADVCKTVPCWAVPRLDP